MRIEIEIPKEFENDYNADRFNEFFSRVLSDIKYHNGACGLFECETAQMFINAFEESKLAYDVEAKVAELEELAEYNGNAYLDCSDVLEIVRGKE